MHDIDIFRSAKLYIDQHGADAPVQAAMKADAMLERGDMQGVTVWNRIVRANGFSVSRFRLDRYTAKASWKSRRDQAYRSQ